ncbi:MAG: LysR family transcriptional regulator [Roseibium sp.]|nr:LysR family transcriptional regulator [Roseibium sp.]
MDTIDPALLRAFVLTARTGSFTKAGETLFRSQSAVSLQIRKLEDFLGERLLRRNARTVVLTPAGERLMTFAEKILDLNSAAIAAFRGEDVSGLIRLGTPEDIATTYLPKALAAFAAAHPKVSLEVTCDLTLNLLDRFRDGRLDVVLLKREPAAPIGGQRVWAEPLVWVAANPELLWPRAGLPLVVSPEPCVYRKRAVEAIRNTGHEPRAAYVCGSLAGALAAVRAGLGIAVLPEHMAPPDLVVETGDRMPALEATEILMVTAADAGLAARRLADVIEAAFEAEANSEDGKTGGLGSAGQSSGSNAGYAASGALTRG